MKGLKPFSLITAVILFLFFWFFNAAFGISVIPISPSGKKVTGDQWLFVIGIDTYLEWPRLETAVNDAKSVKKSLLSRYHFDNEHLIELYDEEATRKNIIGKLRFLAQSLKEDDSLFIFYAGHGYLDPITMSGSWIPVESGTKDVSAWISNNYIKNYLKADAIKARHVLLISDSCFSGDFFRGHRGKLPEVTDEVIRRSYELTSRQAMTSGGLEPVTDSGFGNNSVFTHFLVNAFEKNQSPFLVPSEFFADIKAGVSENAEQFPQFGSLKNTGGQQGGEFVFFLKQNAQLEKLSRIETQKQREYERLKKMELEADTAQKKEAKEIALKEKELVDLDLKIKAMKKLLGRPVEEKNDSLDDMIAMIRNREAQKKNLQELKLERQEEEQKRREIIELLKSEQTRKIQKEIAEDIRKYREIASSKYGEDIKNAAWSVLVQKYPKEMKGLEPGNTKEFLLKAKWNTPVSFTNYVGMEFAFIPPGMFKREQLQVSIKNGFYIGATEITQKQWYEIMGTNPSYFTECGDNCPVEGVSFRDVQTFLQKLNQNDSENKYRLPTEAEWEYACRAGSKTKYYFGDDYRELEKYAWYKKNSNKRTHPVAKKKPNDLGLYDMYGNVWEWCQDWYGKYPGHNRKDNIGLNWDEMRVNKGGSWYNSENYCSSSFRYKYYPTDKYQHLGFRIIRIPE